METQINQANKTPNSEASSGELQGNTLLRLIFNILGVLSAICLVLFINLLLGAFSFLYLVVVVVSLIVFVFCLNVLVLAERSWALPVVALFVSLFFFMNSSQNLMWWAAFTGLGFLVFWSFISRVFKNAQNSFKLNFHNFFGSIYDDCILILVILVALNVFLSSGILFGKNDSFISQESFDKYVLNPSAPLVYAVYPQLRFDMPIGDLLQIKTGFGSISLLPKDIDPNMTIGAYLYKRAKDSYVGLPKNIKLIVMAVLAFALLQTLYFILRIFGIPIAILSGVVFGIFRILRIISIQQRSIPKEYIQL